MKIINGREVVGGATLFRPTRSIAPEDLRAMTPFIYTIFIFNCVKTLFLRDGGKRSDHKGERTLRVRLSALLRAP
jgi:hypothetical protein